MILQNICLLRELTKAMAEVEIILNESFNLCLNESIVVCSIDASTEECLSASEIAVLTSMTTSHTSKVIKSIEEKGLIVRQMGLADKRQMYFKLTIKGKRLLRAMNDDDLEIPEILKPIFNNQP